MSNTENSIEDRVKPLETKPEGMLSFDFYANALMTMLAKNDMLLQQF